MAASRTVRTSLALKISLVGLAQVVLVAAAIFSLLTLNRPPGGGPFEGQARFLVGEIAATNQEPVQINRVADRALRDLRIRVLVESSDGRVLTSTLHPNQPRCSVLLKGKNAEPGESPCHIEKVVFDDGRDGSIELWHPGRPVSLATRMLIVALVVVSIVSLLLARSLTKPLLALSQTALAFGRGDFAVRSALSRSDELGDLSRAFDEMAERVTELLRSEKELLANVSHELRTPLARIRVALDIAAEGDAEVARESLVDISGDLDELERLISDVLTAARLDLAQGAPSIGVPPLRRSQVDMVALLGVSAQRFRSAHADRPLVVELPESLPMIDADPVLLRRVIDNLLENAHKYTDASDAPVHLKAHTNEEQTRLVVDVIDRGMGISEQDLPRVFQPFFRADRSRTRATGGLGLGLALAKRIVDAHSGKLILTSKTDEGTQARVELPIQPTSRA